MGPESFVSGLVSPQKAVLKALLNMPPRPAKYKQVPLETTFWAPLFWRALCTHEWFLIGEKGHTATALPREAQEEPAPGLSRLPTAWASLAVTAFVIVWSPSHVRLFCDPRTVACQVPLFMGFSQARIWEWVAISSSRGSSQPRACLWNLLHAGGFFTAGPPGKPLWHLHFDATGMWCCFTVINCRFVVTRMCSPVSLP